MTKLNLTQEWDKCYPKNEKVNHKKVTFKNHFGIELTFNKCLNQVFIII